MKAGGRGAVARAIASRVASDKRFLASSYLAPWGFRHPCGAVFSDPHRTDDRLEPYTLRADRSKYFTASG